LVVVVAAFNDGHLPNTSPLLPGCGRLAIREQRRRRAALPQLSLEIKRVIAEGDTEATHSHLIPEPGQPGRALADFFRLENGKVVEHWDVIQEISEAAANTNGMF
jgi:predicted SnoaL-like aldol condensation-catalyzing enzyme